MPRYIPPPIERFMAKIELSPDGCWLWTAFVTTWGYGQFGTSNGRSVAAHRWSYEHHVGSIPEGRLVDHICQVRHCVNPAHLRLASKKQNAENTALFATNTSGHQGVCWSKSKNKWRAYVVHEYRQRHCGYFDRLEDAAEAAAEKRRELFTHNDADRTP